MTKENGTTERGITIHAGEPILQTGHEMLEALSAVFLLAAHTNTRIIGV